MCSSLENPRSAKALQHAIHTELTMIRGHAQLAAGHAQCLPAPERDRLLARLEAIDGAVGQIVAHLARWARTELRD